MKAVTDWSIGGAEGQPILGNTHLPNGDPIGVIILAHGFKGYKDYGMFPRIAQSCADAGVIAHRFNFSHSGMTNSIDTFERPDLFERDTWNKQVFDLRAVIDAVQAGTLEGRGLPSVLWGHSRGGVTVLLTAGRYADDPSFPQPAGIITAAAPDTCWNQPEEVKQQLREQGFIESPSGRTGQVLRVGAQFLQEQLDEPESHDVPALTSRIHCPVLVLHGENDPTVHADCASSIADAARQAEKVITIGGDHVFNTPNPLPDTQESSGQLRELLDRTITFAISQAQTQVPHGRGL